MSETPKTDAAELRKNGLLDFGERTGLVKADFARQLERETMQTKSYLLYLESLVISLLDERGSQDDVSITDPNAPPFLKGFTVSPLNAREEIAKQRAKSY